MIQVISTHALREEGDLTNAGAMDDVDDAFLPTPSARRATINVLANQLAIFISTHALREEGDQPLELIYKPTGQFLPTPSARRATQDRILPTPFPRRFLPTPSARRATAKSAELAQQDLISTHALREEGDVGQSIIWVQNEQISTHALREEGDRFGAGEAAGVQISTHALREEGDSI